MRGENREKTEREKESEAYFDGVKVTSKGSSERGSRGGVSRAAARPAGDSSPPTACVLYRPLRSSLYWNGITMWQQNAKKSTGMVCTTSRTRYAVSCVLAHAGVVELSGTWHSPGMPVSTTTTPLQMTHVTNTHTQTMEPYEVYLSVEAVLVEGGNTSS
jgi:hypothetical protein